MLYFKIYVRENTEVSTLDNSLFSARSSRETDLQPPPSISCSNSLKPIHMLPQPVSTLEGFAERAPGSRKSEPQFINK